MNSYYDHRYLNNYRSSLPNYEKARWIALRHFIGKKGLKPNSTLDYGAGSGLFVPLWQELFPHTDLYFSDISHVAMQKLAEKYPQYQNHCFTIQDNSIETEQKFDLILSVEVMEHVDTLEGYVASIYKLLNPGGVFIWTTPCANAFSIEWIYSKFSHQIENTTEGYRRWAWEDSGHLRRLKTTEITKVLEGMGFSTIYINFRAHFFSFFVLSLQKRRLIRRITASPFGKKMKFGSFLDSLIRLDYALFRDFPNGASMIGIARKN